MTTSTSSLQEQSWVQGILGPWLVTYNKSRVAFWSWLLALLGLGLLGIWIPLGYMFANEVDKIPFGKLLVSGELSTFSIVIIIEGILMALAKPKQQRTNPVWIVIGFLVLVFNAVFYAMCVSGTNTKTIKVLVLLLTLASIIIAVHHYMYKTIDFDSAIDAVIVDEKASIDRAIEETKNTSNPVP